MVEEDGCEIMIPLASVKCCGGMKLIQLRGFWRCPLCDVSYGPIGAKQKLAPEKSERPWYEWS